MWLPGPGTFSGEQLLQHTEEPSANFAWAWCWELGREYLVHSRCVNRKQG